MVAPEDWELLYYRTPAWQVPYREWQQSLADLRAAAAAISSVPGEE